MKLHIGCGGHRLEGYVNIDINPSCNPDLVMDLPRNSLVREFGENSVNEIFSRHALEHMSPILDLLWDMWLVSRPGAVRDIEVPHADYEIGNPYHLTRFTEWTFRFFEPNERFQHPQWGTIARGTASEMNPIALEEIEQICANGSVRFKLRVVK